MDKAMILAESVEKPKEWKVIKNDLKECPTRGVSRSGLAF
jgi:hypothetical protein